MHEILETSALNVVSIRLSNTLTQNDHDALVPFIKDQVERYTTTRFCFQLDGLEDWDEDAWASWTLDVRHTRDVDRVAVISDDPWETWLERIDLLFPTAIVKTFGTDASDDAWAWVEGEAKEATATQ